MVSMEMLFNHDTERALLEKVRMQLSLWPNMSQFLSISNIYSLNIVLTYGSHFATHKDK